MPETTRLQLAEAEDLLERVFGAAGLPPDAARSVAGALVAAEAEGQVGHGFSRISDYVAQARSGKVNPAAQISIHERGPASLLIDADLGFAYPALEKALDVGLPRARDMGVCVMAIANSHHCGALSVQVEKIAAAGMIGLMVANTPKAIAPWGGRDPLFGTNPIAFATPRENGPPLVIDLSLSVVARGKVMNAQKSGGEIPLGWAFDKDGQPTTDPEAALDGSMQPIGEAKGTALALMVEVLAAAFTGSAFSRDAGSFFNAEGPAPRVGQTLIAIDPSADDGYLARVADLLNAIEGTPGARLPGARRLAAIQIARDEGICVPTLYVKQAHELAGS